jgi:hypothetical protein
MSDRGSPAEDAREKSEVRPTADHQSVLRAEPLLLLQSLLQDKSAPGLPRRRVWVNQQENREELNQSKNNADRTQKQEGWIDRQGKSLF